MLLIVMGMCGQRAQPNLEVEGIATRRQTLFLIFGDQDLLFYSVKEQVM